MSCRLPELCVLGLVVHRSKPILQEARDVRLGGLDRSFQRTIDGLQVAPRRPGDASRIRRSRRAPRPTVPANRRVDRARRGLATPRPLPRPPRSAAVRARSDRLQCSSRPASSSISLADSPRFQRPQSSPRSAAEYSLRFRIQPSSQLDDVKCCDDELRAEKVLTLPASLHRTHPAHPDDEAHSGSSSNGAAEPRRPR